MELPRLILIDPDEHREVLAHRLRAQGYAVEVHADAAAGANAALAAPPDAVIADLWMPGISGVPLARLLGAEAATMEVPVVLRATTDEPRNRFWARHAGAAAYVSKGRMGELVRALARVIQHRGDGFFLQLGSCIDIRDRISAHLDQALFESVLASEVRALGNVGTFPRLLDVLSQLVVQITDYRWLAVQVGSGRIGVHCRPGMAPMAVAAAAEALGAATPPTVHTVEDYDPSDASEGPGVLVAPISYGGVEYGQLALAPSDRSDANRHLVTLVGRELGGPLRMVVLVEETERLATQDGLTRVLRRGPFVQRTEQWITEDQAVGVVLLDLDHFKRVNDTYGHAVGDRVLVATGELLDRVARSAGGVAGRWGGEEFVLAVPRSTPTTIRAVAEDLWEGLHALGIRVGDQALPVTGSFGAAVSTPGEDTAAVVGRADHAMYAAKEGGRDRVVLAATPREPPAPSDAGVELLA